LRRVLRVALLPLELTRPAAQVSTLAEISAESGTNPGETGGLSGGRAGQPRARRFLDGALLQEEPIVHPRGERLGGVEPRRRRRRTYVAPGAPESEARGIQKSRAEQ